MFRMQQAPWQRQAGRMHCQGQRFLLFEIESDQLQQELKKGKSLLAICLLALSCGIVTAAENVSVSRTRITQDSFDRFPEDLRISKCRQCVDPACVKGKGAENLVSVKTLCSFSLPTTVQLRHTQRDRRGTDPFVVVLFCR